jgi:hypothetical protein
MGFSHFNQKPLKPDTGPQGTDICNSNKIKANGSGSVLLRELYTNLMVKNSIFRKPHVRETLLAYKTLRKYDI